MSRRIFGTLGALAGAAALLLSSGILGIASEARIYDSPKDINVPLFPSLSVEENVLFISGLPITVTIDPETGKVTNIAPQC